MTVIHHKQDPCIYPSLLVESLNELKKVMAALFTLAVIGPGPTGSKVRAEEHHHHEAHERHSEFKAE